MTRKNKKCPPNPNIDQDYIDSLFKEPIGEALWKKSYLQDYREEKIHLIPHWKKDEMEKKTGKKFVNGEMHHAGIRIVLGKRFT